MKLTVKETQATELKKLGIHPIDDIRKALEESRSGQGVLSMKSDALSKHEVRCELKWDTHIIEGIAEQIPQHLETRQKWVSTFLSVSTRLQRRDRLK